MITEWCRVCQFYAGADFGAFWIPEVGTEVLVAFVHGDMRLPVILGGLYNGLDKPSSHRNDDTDEKVIRTRAGHEIVFDDQSGQEKITIIDSSTKNSIVINTKSNEITIEAKEGKIILNGVGGVEIKSSKKIILDAGSDLDATAKGTMNLKGSTAINLN